MVFNLISRIFFILSFVGFALMLMKWSKEKDGAEGSIYDDYSNPKPPLYVYFNSSGIPLPSIKHYFLLVGMAGLLIMAISQRVLENMFASIIFLYLVGYAGKQFIIVQSIRRSQDIDNDAPGFLSIYGNLMQTVDSPLFVLGQAIPYAHRSYQVILAELLTRLQNGQDPYGEVERTKRFFRNRILRNFLDDFASTVYRENVLNQTIERLILRAEDRKEQIAERKIDTIAGVLTIYFGLLFEVLVTGLVSLFRPDWMSVFVNTGIGQVAVGIMVAISGGMILLAQRLVLISEV